MPIGRNTHPTAPDVRMEPQSVTRPTSGSKIDVSINPHHTLFTPYEYRKPSRFGLVPLVPKGA